MHACTNGIMGLDKQTSLSLRPVTATNSSPALATCKSCPAGRTRVVSVQYCKLDTFAMCQCQGIVSCVFYPLCRINYCQK